MIGIGEENMRSGPRERKCEMRCGPIEKNMRGGSKERKCGRRFEREKMWEEVR